MSAEDSINLPSPCRRAHPDPVRSAIAAFATDLDTTLAELEPATRVRILLAIRDQVHTRIVDIVTENPALAMPEPALTEGEN